jgi:ABC-type branched-subunit amino acid transport system substrate-binding protein
MIRPVFPAAALLFLAAVSVPVPCPAAPEEAASVERLVAEGNRWFARGGYRTAARVYQTAETVAGQAGLSRPALFRWGAALFHEGNWRGAADRLRRLPPGDPGEGVDGRLLRLYLGYSLIRIDAWADASVILKGTVDPLRREESALRTGLNLSRSLADGGDRPGALLFLDRLWRDTAGEDSRGRILDGFEALAADSGLPILASMLREGRLADPARGAIPAWLARLTDGGRPQVALEIIGGLPVGSGDAAFRLELDRLKTRAEAVRDRRLVKIGVLLPLSGAYRVFGEKISRAFSLALDEARDVPVSFVVRDTGGDPAAAAAAAADLADNAKVAAILGPILSSEAERVIKEIGPRKIAVLSPTAQAPGLTAAGRPFFRNCLTLQQQGRWMAGTAVRSLGLTRFAILSPDDNYGRALSKAFWDEVLVLGGTVVYSSRYGLDQTDFAKEIRALKGEEEVQDVSNDKNRGYSPPYDAVYIPDTYNRVGLIAPQLSFHDIERNEVIILGSNGLNTPDFVRVGEDYAEGVIFPDGFFAGRPDALVRDFVGRWRSRYGETPDVMAAQAFDAAGIILSLVRRGKTSPVDIRAGLEAVRDYPGVCGPTSFGSDGEMVREPVLVTVTHGRLTEFVTTR